MVFRWSKIFALFAALSLLASCGGGDRRPPLVVLQKERNRPVDEAFLGFFQWPLVSKINSKYGKRSRGFHEGLDIEGDKGDAIVAAAAGEVIFAGSFGYYGKLVILKHDNGLFTTYAHNSKNAVKEGRRVDQGQKLAEVGRTGNASGDHLHFEIRDARGTYDPLELLPPREPTFSQGDQNGS